MKEHNDTNDDRALNWTLIVMGTTILLSSAFFLYRELSLSAYYNYFFSLTALIGTGLAAAGIIAANMDTSWQPDEKQMTAARHDE